VHALRVLANRADLAVYRRIRLMGHREHRVVWVRRYSRLGEHAALWLALGATGVLADPPRRRRWGRAAACVGTAYCLSTAIKLAVNRRRPALEDLPHLMATPTGLSFPSSHATSSFAAARAYGRLLPGQALYPVAAGMAFSRLYLGVHYPSDVLAGAALGTLLGELGR